MDMTYGFSGLLPLAPGAYKEPIMAIQRLTKQQFDDLHPVRHPLLALAGEEKAWFVLTETGLLGTIVLDRSDKDWNFVVLSRQEDGQYQCTDTGVSFPTQADAEQSLMTAMRSSQNATSDC
jgi:hypothetical protein